MNKILKNEKIIWPFLGFILLLTCSSTSADKDQKKKIDMQQQQINLLEKRLSILEKIKNKTTYY